ncbi:hypothetical protein Hanom_Chr07g00645471 [Helianthus anomalus]
MDVDEDSDPIMPPSGSPTHPIEISSGSASYAGSPYKGPDEISSGNLLLRITTPHNNSLHKRKLTRKRWNNHHHNHHRYHRWRSNHLRHLQNHQVGDETHACQCIGGAF